MSFWYDDLSPRSTSSRRVVSFCADQTSDLASLPTSTTEGIPQGTDSTLHNKVAKGSTCLVIEDSSVWMLNSSDEWCEL